LLQGAAFSTGVVGFETLAVTHHSRDLSLRNLSLRNLSLMEMSLGDLSLRDGLLALS